MEELKSLLHNAVQEGDSTTVGLLCHLKQVREFLHGHSVLSFLRHILERWGVTADSDDNGENAGRNSTTPAAHPPNVAQHVRTDSNDNHSDSDDDTAGNNFSADHRAALRILLREIQKGSCFSHFSTSRSTDQDENCGSLLHCGSLLD